MEIVQRNIKTRSVVFHLLQKHVRNQQTTKNEKRICCQTAIGDVETANVLYELQIIIIIIIIIIITDFV